MTPPASGNPQMLEPSGWPAQDAPKLSVVVPVYNEADSLRALRAAIGYSLDPLKWSYEVLLVDDASTDSSRAIYETMLKADPRLRVILFRTNRGQTAAMAAGFRYAQGEVVVTMDGDLQNDPADIPRLVTELERGHDIVCGWRRERKDRRLTRLLPSRLANMMISMVTGVSLHDTGCSLKAYKGWVIRSLTLYSDMHRFIGALSVGIGARITEIPVRHHARRYGESKYCLTRIFKVMLDLIVVKMLIQFSTQPIRWFLLLALPVFASTGMLIVVGILSFNDEGYDNPLIAGASVSLLVALNLFLLGFLAELQLKSSGFFRRRASTIRGERI